MTIVTSLGQNTILTLGHIAVALRHEEKVSREIVVLDCYTRATKKRQP